MADWDEVQIAWDNLRRDDTFQTMRGRLCQRTSCVSWRQTLSAHFTAACGPCKVAPVISLKDCGLDTVLKDEGGYYVRLFFLSSFVTGDGGSFKCVGPRQATKKLAQAEACLDVVTAVLVAAPRKIRLAPSCFGELSVEELRSFAERLHVTDVWTWRIACAAMWPLCMRWMPLVEERARTFRVNAPGSASECDDEGARLLFRMYFSSKEEYVGNKSPAWVRVRLIQLVPRDGLREFVDRHLDVFRWINRKDCVFAGLPTLFIDSYAPGSASVEDTSMMDADGVICRFDDTGLPTLRIDSHATGSASVGETTMMEADRVICSFEDLD